MITTKTEVFDAIEAHFSKPDAVLGQGPPDPDDLLSGGVVCLYRGDKDPASPVRCGIGAIIPDELYRTFWENKSVSTIFDELIVCGVIGRERDFDDHFLTRVQDAHDVSTSVEGFLDRLKTLRKDYGA